MKKTSIFKRLLSILLTTVLLILLYHNPIYGAVTTGYHLEYHDAHAYKYLGGETDSSGTYRETYAFPCNGDVYKYYQWSWYTTATSAWGESSITDANGKVTKAVAEPSFDNFKKTFLPKTLDCPGYEVANTYTITYDGNNHTSGSMKDSSHTYDQSQKLTKNAYSRTGYTFKEWNTKADGSGTSYANQTSVKNLTSKNKGTVTLYARWTANKYLLTFDANGGTTPTTSKEITYNKTYGELPEPSRDGYSFDGWFTTLKGGTKITSSTKVNITSDQKLYARWSAIPYQVTYDANGGTTSAKTKTYYYEEEVDLNPTATKNAYTFVGWALSPNAKIPLGSYKMPAKKVTLYALYTIDVSDVANHTYPDYNKTKDLEVYVSLKKSDGRTKTYPLTYTKDVARMTYQYVLNNTNISSFVGNNSYEWSLVAFDNARNYSFVGSTPATPTEYFDQTVQHWTLNAAKEKVNNFHSTQESIKKGLTYTPQPIADAKIPAGYQFSSIDSAYSVTGNKVSYAYYTPKNYTLTFQPQGGTVSPSSKLVTYNEPYGSMPTPIKTGHRFIGWYTATNGGEEKTSADSYLTTNNSTLYAHWQTNSYHVTYDYRTNGGDSVSKTGVIVPYGSAIDLSVSANKNGWDFVGWNTDPNATTKLSSLSMKEGDITLYAIYKKDLTATFIDGANKQTRRITKTLYNRDTASTITIPTQTAIAGWKSRGWSFHTEGSAQVHAASGSTYSLNADKSFYGCYVQDITIRYDTNGSSQTILPQTKERSYNAFGNYENPVFITSSAPILDKHTFVYWVYSPNNGSTQSFFSTGISLTADRSMTLTAKWDAYPELEAYDRYFTLKDAIEGKITVERLLEKVNATDKEDGILTKGIHVIVKDYNAATFKNLSTNADLSITYKATDSFGNIVEKHVTVYIADTTVTQSSKRSYARFIRTDFYQSLDSFISNEIGGLESTSIWRTNPAYQRLLEHALENETPIDTFSFSKDDLSQLD